MQRSWSQLQRRSVARAIELCHDIGSEKFIARTRFKESNRYGVMDRGMRIDSKPLLANAFQLQFNCGKDDVPRLSGGGHTRSILYRLGYTLVDLRSEPPEHDNGMSTIAVGASTQFWWANQSQNFPDVFEGGTLWAAHVGRGGQLVDHWLSLRNAKLGDVVFHYASPEIRAVSQVATAPRPSYPPAHYDMPEGAEGTLVLTEPVAEVHVPREEALAVLMEGTGPVNAGGTLRNGYFFELDSVQALELLRRAGVEPDEEARSDGLETSEPVEEFLGGLSDRLAIRAVRAEQHFLRGQQIRKWGSSCCLCGRFLPEELLVAAHIKPRWACTETERMDIGNVAMLACLFGCDGLYELGYIVVGDDGVVERGVRNSVHVEDHLQKVLGRACLVHTEYSRRYFSWHRQHHFDAQGDLLMK